MKLVVPAFLLGSAIGIAATWFALRSDAPANRDGSVSVAAPADQSEVSRLRNQVTLLKQEVTTLRGQSSTTAANSEPDKTTSGAEVESKITEIESDKELLAKADRLAERLKLTPQQRASLESLLGDQNRVRIANSKAVQNIAIQKKRILGEELSEEEKAWLKSIGVDEKVPSVMDWTRENLSPEQVADYQRYKQEQKVTKAEAVATNYLNGLSSIVDLSGEQKDKIFKHFSDDTMKMPDLEDLPDLDEPGAVTVVVDSVEDPYHFFKSIFTPEQFEAYERHQERERKAQAEKMEMLDILSLPIDSIK